MTAHASRVAPAVLMSVLASPPAAAASCESLAALQLPNTTITAAQVFAASGFVPPAAPGAEARAEGAAPARGVGGGTQGRRAGGAARGPRLDDLPAFCSVAATVRPTSDSDIRIEVWMPVSGWNGKFLSAGGAQGANSALGGSLNVPAMADALRAGFATAGTDNGHAGANASFALGHPDKLIDFAYRATHEMTVKAKAIVEAFYGSGPKYSYWEACAAGGRQGLQEAQRFPADYNGIIVSAPANNWARLQTWSMWLYQLTHKNEASYIPPAKYPALHKAAIDACDRLDGVEDGIIDDPARCRFDPKVLECKAEERGPRRGSRVGVLERGPQRGSRGGVPDTTDCLTPAQVESARAIYAPIVNPRTKREIYPGMAPGSELGWNALAGAAQPLFYASETFKYLVFKNPGWDPATRPINLDADVVLADREAGIVSAVNPDLKEFFARGGKLIQYHGWTDPLIAPGDSVNYYNGVALKLGGASTIHDSYRLFMVPGMNHCRGGEGTDTIDMLSVMQQWVERGKAPEQVTASRVVNGTVERTRPLCPYPQVATYLGTGSADDAANFVCKAR